MKLVLGTRNEHKRRELSRLLVGHELEKLDDAVALPPEDGATFEENALAKARAVTLATGRPAIGEDSGIEAAALGGAPGVRSARYASDAEANASDEANLAKLRREAPVGSALRYVCALAYADSAAGVEHVVHGYCTGVLAPEQRGAGGFGYDPVFVPDEGSYDRTMAELTDAEKDAISHRGNAARALAAWLAEVPAASSESVSAR